MLINGYTLYLLKILSQIIYPSTNLHQPTLCLFLPVFFCISVCLSVLPLFCCSLSLSMSFIKAYFRIQRKCQPCSKRKSYFGNKIWSNSPKLMRIESISYNRCKQIIQLHARFVLYCFFYNLSSRFRDSWESLVMVEGEHLDYFCFFSWERYSDTTPKV